MLYNNVGIINLYSSEDSASESTLVYVFDHPTVVWRPLFREPYEYKHKAYNSKKLDSLGYIFAADSVGQSSFKFSL